MVKKLIFLAVLALLFAIPVHADTSKVFLSCNAAFVLPTDDGAGTYDPDFGVNFDGFYAVGKHVSLGGSYKSWRLKSETSDTKLSGSYTGGSLIYWVNENGAKLNLGFLGGVGQSKIAEGNEINQNLAEIFGMVAKYKIFENIYATGTVKIGRFGDLQHDALMVSLGIGAPISF